jgi:hypothetical protein
VVILLLTYRLCDVYVYDWFVVNGGDVVKRLWYKVVM